MSMNKLIKIITKQLKNSGIRIANADQVNCSPPEFEHFCHKLWNLDKSIAQIQTDQGIYYYKSEAVVKINETSFFHRNLLSDADVEKYMRANMKLALETKLATCVSLCITAYFMAMDAQKAERDQVIIEVIQAKHWSHNLVSLKQGDNVRYFDPWVLLQPKRFPF